MSNPMVTVCIPVYNCEEYLAEAINSVLCQTWKDYELIILDNASTDNTANVIKSFTDSRIRVIRNSENIGFCGNWNLALTEAKGRYIKILPADDYLTPECLEKQVAVLEADAHVVLVGSGRKIIRDDGKELFRGKRIQRMIPAARAVSWIIRSGGNPVGEPGAVLFRRGPVDNGVRFCPDRLYVIDLDFYCKLLNYGDLFVVGIVGAAFRINRGSESVALASRQTAQYISFANDLYYSGVCNISRATVMLGKVMARIKGVLRLVFYKVYMT